MLRFFRQIRQNLLTENKFGKYLMYVIIEVFIVIIGILIAIRVDNRNEERIGAENTNLLFKEVSDELVQNIKSLDRIIDVYIFKDSLYFKVLNKKVEYKDYKTSPILFQFAFTSDPTNLLNPLAIEVTGLVDEDFKELLARKNNLTEPQDSIFSELKDLYGKRKRNVDMDDETIHNTQLNFRDKMMNGLPWWSNYVTKNVVTDEMIQYALNDSFYLNQLSELRFREQQHTEGMLWFRTEALNLYVKITDMLKIEKDTSLVKDIADYEHVKGFYVWKDAKVEIRGENKLIGRLFHKDSILLDHSNVYPFYNSHLIIWEEKKGENWLAKIEFAKDGEVLGLSWFGNMGEENDNRIISKKIE